ncbi:M15 family metallopeptidase [Bradyrhizobium sp. USDA 4452]
MVLPDYTIDTSNQSGTSDSLKRRRMYAEALMKQGMDSTPAAGGPGGGWVTVLNRGLAGALGGYQSGQLDRQETEGDRQKAQWIAKALGADSSPTVAPGIPSASGLSEGPLTAGPTVQNDANAIPGTVGMDQRLADRTQDFIQDNPGTSLSSGIRSRDDQARLYADRANNPNPVAPPGTSLHEQGLAADIGGMTPAQRAMLPQYGLAQPVANDPVHVQLAGNDDDDEKTPANAQPTQGQLPNMPRRPQPNIAAAMAVINSPYASAAEKQVMAAIVSGATKQDQWSSAGNGYLYNSRTGEGRRLYEADDKTPTSVLEYNFYLKNFKPSPTQPQPMDYATFSVQKARAGAANTSVVVGGENKGLDEARKLDAEAVRKGQNETTPALEDADHNFQMMQDAIERNGGKLPTGGALAKAGLDLARTADYIKNNWGVDLGGDPTTLTSLETFNKGGIKASGDMAKAIGGSRVLKVEFENAQRANPGLETSDGGNKYLLDLNRNGIAIKRDYLQAQEDYWRENNHSLDGFQKKWNAEIKAKPSPAFRFQRRAADQQRRRFAVRQAPINRARRLHVVPKRPGWFGTDHRSEGDGAIGEQCKAPKTGCT